MKYFILGLAVLFFATHSVTFADNAPADPKAEAPKSTQAPTTSSTASPSTNPPTTNAPTTPSKKPDDATEKKKEEIAKAVVDLTKCTLKEQTKTLNEDVATFNKVDTKDFTAVCNAAKTFISSVEEKCKDLTDAQKKLIENVNTCGGVVPVMSALLVALCVMIAQFWAQ